ncbi:hypothetical protein IFU00_01395 [Oxalobacteraceae sp. CFBP 8761]|jgi:hypothetical protein|nr:hypothetical protein [Oxalobacteraceae sp. CFBP 8761]
MTINIADLPGVRAQFKRDVPEAGIGQARGPSNLVGVATQLPAGGLSNLPSDLKTMALRGGRYYVVSEQK